MTLRTAINITEQDYASGQVSKPMRLVFMGTPEFAVPSLRAVVEAGHQVALVVTQPDKPAGRGLKPTPPPVKVAAQALGLRVFQPEKLNVPESLRVIADAHPDAIVVVAYGKILREACLAIPPKGCINVHPSLLPKYRGPAPIQHALLNGDSETGVTTMFMDAGMDTGDIILQRVVPIDPDDTAGSLTAKLATVAAELLVETLALVERGEAPRTPQEHEQATYAPFLPDEIAHLDFSQPAERLRNLIRALHPEPGAFAFFRGKRVKFWRAKAVGQGEMGRGTGGRGQDIGMAKAPPGMIVEVGKSHLLIATGDGFLMPTELQTEGRKVLPVAEWLRGTQPKVGERFEGRQQGASGE
jgi:methionyl-tRNA formyltransferase